MTIPIQFHQHINLFNDMPLHQHQNLPETGLAATTPRISTLTMCLNQAIKHRISYPANSCVVSALGQLVARLLASAALLARII